ncbi:ATP-binding cassette sub-family C member 4-like [Onthophagus taurus]|uniref:ATP-binding cassette sub-family C member 4-like n=1 Tax=Onthophagus taurus TaxID=166361 RepID=UPI0039BDEFCE
MSPKVPTAKNPRETANIFSYCTFAWFMPTFLKGYQKQLNEEDLFKTLDSQKSSYLGDRLEQEWEREKLKDQPSLTKAIWEVFGINFVSYALVAVATELIFKVGQGLSFIRLLKYFSDDTSSISTREAYVYASVLIICGFAIAIGSHLYMFGYQILGMKVRVACCSLIYRKSLKISKGSMGNTTVGHLVNLLTNDVSRFDFAAIFINSLWLSPLQSIVVMIILCFETGWTGIIGVLVFIIVIPIQILVGKKISILRLQTASITDERVKVMNEILSGIQVIKMYTWEQPFIKLINRIRNSEIKKIRYTSFLISVTLAFINFLPKLGVFASVIGFVLAGYILNPMHVFSLVVFYNMLKLSLNIYFPQGMFRTAEALVSVKRIQEFLSEGEISNLNGFKEKYKKIEEIREIDKPIGVEFINASSKWDKKLTENTLENLSLKIQNSSLVAVVGSVGSGKSSFLNVILKELPLISGKIDVQGTISYSPQEAWFFIGTVKDNILFGQPYNETRYKKVIKVCALERDLSIFPKSDQTIIVENGANLSGGQKARINLARAVYKNSDIYLLDDPLAAVDSHVAKQIFDECISKYLNNKCVILVTNQLQFLKYVDYIYLLENGKLASKGTYKYLQEANVGFLKILGDVGDEKSTLNPAEIHDDYDYNGENEENNDKEARDDGMVDLKVYKTYLKAGGRFYIHFLILLVVIVYEGACTIADAAVSYWSNVDKMMVINNGTSTETLLTRDDHMVIFAGIIIVVIITAVISAIGCFMLLIEASKNLHNRIFGRVVTAPMRFFHLNPSGRILNRFSRDLGLLDDYLPGVIIDALVIALVIVGVLILETAINPWLCLAMILLLTSLYVLRLFYLPSSIAIKRLEGITRSPVYTHMNTSLQGLSTIRAFREQTSFVEVFDNYQDIHTSTWFMYLSSIHAFGFLIDALCVVLVFIVTFSFFIVEESSAGIAGLAITQSIMMMEITQWCIRQFCEMTNNMTSVERITEYLELDVDGNDVKRDTVPDEKWPEFGGIEFDKVSLRYDPAGEPVLKKLTFKIKPGEKVGIVGRTGAGKSSLSLSLFQLAYTDGNILIDDVNIKEIPLQNLRSKIAIIPQEPVLFSETMRKNLDPFEEYNDNDLWNALGEVELKDVVKDFSEGLLTKMSEGGSNLSVGQRQLVCLARAIIKKNKILIMDEATANVDPKTDALIQTTIRKKFRNCTVLTIAHRLHTIIDSDVVLVMDAGEVKEFDHPHILLQNKGAFFEMVEKTGIAMSANLHEIAQNSYNNINKKEVFSEVVL